MSRSSHSNKPPDPDALVIVANFPMPAGTRFEWHAHRNHQLAWAASGVLTVQTASSTFILPPSRALWIPAGVRHETRSDASATMRALYINRGRSTIRWKGATPVAVNALAAQLIGYLDDSGLKGARRARAEALLPDLLVPVSMATIDVRMPVTAPARAVAEQLLNAPAESSTLAEWGRRAGASERTLARAFVAEAGMTFGRWRTFVRLQAALSRLAAGAKVATVAADVGYETPSAFVAAFRRETGVTPMTYFRRGVPPIS